MTEYVRNELKRKAERIYKIREELERMFNSLDDMYVETDMYRNDNQIEDGEEEFKAMEEAKDMLYDTIDELLDITTLLETAYGVDFES